MSLWALAVFIISAITACLTLWALWYVRGTLIATREALEDTGKATAAMVRQNQLTEAAQRPWITIKGYVPFEVQNCIVSNNELYKYVDVKRGVAAQAIWTNTGARPASGISFHGRAFLVPLDTPPPDYIFPDPTEFDAGRSLAVGQTINADLFVLDDADAGRFKRREIEVIVYARCRYELAHESGEYGESIVCLRVSFRSRDDDLAFDQSTAHFTNANFPDSYQ